MLTNNDNAVYQSKYLDREPGQFCEQHLLQREALANDYLVCGTHVL